jgi:hypothetical protein
MKELEVLRVQAPDPQAALIFGPTRLRSVWVGGDQFCPQHRETCYWFLSVPKIDRNAWSVSILH